MLRSMLFNASHNLIFTALYAYKSTYALIFPNQYTSNITTNVLYTFVYKHIVLNSQRDIPTSLPSFLSKTQNNTELFVKHSFIVIHALVPTSTTCLTISNHHLASDSISLQNIVRFSLPYATTN